MYNWRKLRPEEREVVLKSRILRRQPWHAIPHHAGRSRQYLLTAACYEHQKHIGKTPERIASFENSLVSLLLENDIPTHGHVVLPNHYHLLVTLPIARGVGHEQRQAALLSVLKLLFSLHQKTGFCWNKEDDTKGRRVWANVAESSIRSERHFNAVVNYIHHNPVKHGYCSNWGNWPYSSAADYLETLGREEAIRRWREFDISDMGSWDNY